MGEPKLKETQKSRQGTFLIRLIKGLVGFLGITFTLPFLAFDSCFSENKWPWEL